jgi:DNA invertase Pin-like site-specific DNA recombinase
MPPFEIITHLGCLSPWIHPLTVSSIASQLSFFATAPVRVSTFDQNVSRQLSGVEVDRTFTDKASGKDVKRPQLDALMTFVREGDTVICHSMDRLGRNLDDLRKLVLGLTGRGIQVVFVKENLTFVGDDSPMANLLLSVMGAFSQFECELIRERQREGIELAKRAGVYKGRKRVLPKERAAELARRVAAGESKAELGREFGVDRTTVYRYLAREGKRKTNRRKR